MGRNWWVGLAGVLLLSLVLFQWISSRNPGSEVVVTGSSSPAVGLSTQRGVNSVPAEPASSASTPNALPPSATAKADSRSFPKPELTRPLAQPALITIADRNWAVLGTRDVATDRGPRTTLILQEETSGQVDYRQAVLRFVLREGEDYERFIRSRSNVTRVFVNSLYADIAVDPSLIGAEYAVLAQDPRVVKVYFVPIEVRAVPK